MFPASEVLPWGPLTLLEAGMKGRPWPSLSERELPPAAVAGVETEAGMGQSREKIWKLENG